MEHDGCIGCSYEKQDEHLEPCLHCDGTKQGDKYKRMTNADRIRDMTDEELAEFLPVVSNMMCKPTDECMKNIFNCGECEKTKECALNWLQSEVEV